MDTKELDPISVEAPELGADWEKPPTLMALKQILQDALPSHNAKVAKIEGWLENLHVTGKAQEVGSPQGSKIVPKLIRKQAEWRYPALSEPFLSSPEMFKVLPVSWEDRKAAQQNALVLNNQFNTQIDRVRFIDEYVRTAVDEGTVTVRVGWEFQESEDEEEVPVFDYVEDPSFAPTIQMLDQLKQSDYAQYHAQVPEELREAHRLSGEVGVPVRPEHNGKTEKKKKVKKNRPTVEVCDFRDVIVDPSCKGDLTKAGFVIFKFQTCKADLMKDGKYTNLKYINMETESILGSDDTDVATRDLSSSGFTYKDDVRKKFWVYEYWGWWDLNGDGVLVPIVAAWAGQVQIRLEKNPYPDQAIPFVLEQFLPVRRSTHGEPDGALLEDNQKIMGAVMRGMIDILGKSANGQTGMRKDMLDSVNRRKWEKGEDYEFNPGVDPRVGVHMHTFAEIPASAQFMLQLQQMEAESLTGVKAYSQGISASALGDVAAAVRGALDAASKRELAILRRLSAGIVSIGRKILAMNAVFLSDEEVIRVTNETFVPVRRDDLAGNFDLKLTISTAEEDNNKAEQLAFMLQTFGPNADPGLVKMILADIARLRKMPDLAARIEKFQPQPDPLMQQKMQLEIQLMQAQLMETQAKAQKLLAEAQLAGVKQGTEGAKQEHLRADVDKKNLDFMEQERGVTQERNLQLAGEQARSQAELKQMDHQLEREKMGHDLIKEYIKTKNKPQG